MHGLYAIVDTKMLAERDVDALVYAKAVLAARPAALQLRAKEMPAREILRLLRALGPMCRQAGVPLVANDRADLAALGGSQIVHIGQEDLPFELVHRICPQLEVGVSTHNVEQLEKAIAQRPSYVAYGPVYETASKSNADPVVGLEGLARAARLTRHAGIPLVAIGGITMARVAEVAVHADAFAVIADLFQEGATMGDVTARAQAFQAAFAAAYAPRPAEAAS